MQSSVFRKVIASAGLLFIIAGFAVWKYLPQTEVSSLPPGKVAASGEKKTDVPYQGVDWSLKNLEGQEVRLSDYQGRPVLLVFWATWCPYCKKLLPGIAELNEKYESKGLKVIAVNIREDWKPEVYWRNHEYKFDAVLEGDAVAENYGITGTPGLVFIDPDGEVLGIRSFSDPQHPLLEKFAVFYTKE
ncbi:peroxiredoxin family protein [Aliikangiella coralliicola]|uniref:TlpA family protein disulfide reductase n=1 Tax=Aliikangiella coralliicola TaxID=2592383 RepID=A0A545U6D8_9GAMM|nr:TlpA disulfide reductase family protein [Aliikangiella coralliicola]TQV85041.1 TlpA family protein disulfide reductase [Aliikangiella coralliicola]